MHLRDEYFWALQRSCVVSRQGFMGSWTTPEVRREVRERLIVHEKQKTASFPGIDQQPSRRPFASVPEGPGGIAS